jgi:hypothetical protein
MAERSLSDLLNDLYERAQPQAPSRNRAIRKFATVQDSFALSSDLVITTVVTPPYHWATDAASTDTDMVWDYFEWA